MRLIVPAAIEAMGNHTAVKGGAIVLYCNVSGTSPLTVLWNHVKSGGTRNQKKWTIGDIQVEKLGEYRCNANNKYGGDLIFNSHSLQVVFVRNHVQLGNRVENLEKYM